MIIRKLSEKRSFHMWMICLAVICLGSVFPSLSPPRQADFLIHLLAYFFLALIPLVQFTRREFAFMAAAVVPVMGLTLEYVQSHINGRTFSTEDMLANNIGAGLGIVTGMALRFIRRSIRISGEHNE